ALPAAPVVESLGDPVDQFGVQAQCLARIAQDTAVAVGGDHSGQGRTVTTVFFINVLDDFFATLVLEVDVNVRRFFARLTDKARKQGIAVFRVDFGDAQAIAHGGIGGRAPALAQDIAGFGELHNVVHRQ